MSWWIDGSLSAFGELVDGDAGSKGARFCPLTSAEGMTCFESVGEALIESLFWCEGGSSAFELVLIFNGELRPARIDWASSVTARASPCVESALDRINEALSALTTFRPFSTLFSACNVKSTAESVDFLGLRSCARVPPVGEPTAFTALTGGGSSCWSAITVSALGERLPVGCARDGRVWTRRYGKSTSTESPGSSWPSSGDDAVDGEHVVSAVP